MLTIFVKLYDKLLEVVESEQSTVNINTSQGLIDQVGNFNEMLSELNAVKMELLSVWLSICNWFFNRYGQDGVQRFWLIILWVQTRKEIYWSGLKYRNWYFVWVCNYEDTRWKNCHLTNSEKATCDSLKLNTGGDVSTFFRTIGFIAGEVVERNKLLSGLF